MTCLGDVLCGAVIGVHAVSLHAPAAYPSHVNEHEQVLERQRFEKVTPGVYVVLESGLTVGVLRNSYRRTSVYAGWTWRSEPFALTAGAITGYGSFRVSGPHAADDGSPYSTVHHGRPLQPLLVPSLGMPMGDHTTARLSLLPAFGKDGAAALHLSIEWR